MYYRAVGTDRIRTDLVVPHYLHMYIKMIWEVINKKLLNDTCYLDVRQKIQNLISINCSITAEKRTKNWAEDIKISCLYCGLDFLSTGKKEE